MPRTLITGGFGFLGTWLAAALRRGGHEVVLVDNREVEGTPLWLSGLLGDPAVSTGRADVTEPGALDPWGKFDYLLHAAAVLGVTRVREAPRSTIMVNTLGTEMTLRFAAQQPDLKRFVLFSTSEVYGDLAERTTEDDWLSVRVDDPRWSYAVSKAAAEAMTVAYAGEYGLPFVTVRPFNVYGPLRTSGYAVNALAERALAGEPLTVHGDGAQVRAWCHVEDFVNGVLRAMRSPEVAGQAVNIGDDRHVLTIGELAEHIREIAGSASEIRYASTGAPDIRHRKPNLDRARTVLGHQPRRDLTDGLRETIAWLRGGSGPYRIELTREDWPAWE
ncbi:NAD-dependent epimerase/dehydratase family protein [Streptomyces marincola]|uniref:NAD-dependent epimerase/dehydratase family protein n=1 Tax=Streptomyces marincola TaxID=2878388 RepID=UPI00131D680B|nr:NAD-dependent epimerase/dehydratase family protein [Streptomyces marincola]